jgi:hypothetical protein
VFKPFPYLDENNVPIMQAWIRLWIARDHIPFQGYRGEGRAGKVGVSSQASINLLMRSGSRTHFHVYTPAFSKHGLFLSSHAIPLIVTRISATDSSSPPLSHHPRINHARLPSHPSYLRKCDWSPSEFWHGHSTHACQRTILHLLNFI